MVTPDYVRLMARYNTWQNENIISLLDEVSEQERSRERGAFFGSIEKTLNHILWADEMWLHRLDGRAAPDGAALSGSVQHTADWNTFKRVRSVVDQDVIDWSAKLNSDALKGELKWFSGGLQKNLEQPIWILVTHMFNHQTHHRGQVHCMMSQIGLVTRVTDLPAMPELFNV